MNQSESTMDSMLLRVQLLGTLRLALASAQTTRVISLPPGLLANLFGYLALYPGMPIPRSRLAGILNPDVPEPNARRALTDALYRLRRDFGQAFEWIHADAECVRLDVRNLWVDVRAFEQGVVSSQIDDWERALDLYGGDLLQDLDCEWLFAPRAALRDQFLATHERLCAALMQAQQFPRALAWVHRWTLADPLCEQAHRLAMQLYAMLERYAAALEQFEHLSRLLAEELHAVPLPETRALAESIRHEYEIQLEQSRSRSAFVGRRRERATLVEHAERTLAGKGGIVLVEGEPGIGKTRLLEEFAESARWRGLTVTWGRSQPLAAVSPFAPLDQALAAALAGPRCDQVRSKLAPEMAQVAAFIVPRLQPESPHPSPQLPDLPQALTVVLQTLAALAPQVLILDDMQWADANFWEVAEKIASSLAERALLIVLSYRSEELRANSVAWSHLCGLDRELALSKIILKKLDLMEVLELARSLGELLSESEGLTLFERAEGNPLFFLEALATPGRVSASFNAQLERRWARLTPNAQAALQAGAVLGREFKHGTWQSVASTDIVDPIPLLVTTRFIEETEHGYAFQHDLTREFVYRTIEKNKLRDWHRHAGHALARENADAGVLAWHFEQAHEWREAICYYREAGARAEKAYACQVALEHYNRGLGLVALVSDAEKQRIELLCGRQRTLGLLLPGAEWRAAVADLEQAATAAQDKAAMLEAMEARMGLCVQDGNWQRMESTAQNAIALAQELDNRGAEARLEHTLGWHLSDSLGREEAALAHLERAMTLAQAVGATDLFAEAMNSLAFAQRMLGRCALARETVDQVLAVTENQPALRSVRASGLISLAQIEWDLAHWEAARAAIRTATTLKEELLDAWSLGTALFNHAIITQGMGQHAEARASAVRLVQAPSPTDNVVMHNNAMWVRALLAQVEISAGDLVAAEQTLAPMREWMQATKSGRALLLALRVLGELKLAQDRPREALAPLTRAVELWQQEPTIEIVPLLYLALAAHRLGESTLARNCIAQAEQMLKPREVARHNVLMHAVRHQIFGRKEDLLAAHAELQRQAALFTDEKLRADFLTQVILHREIEERWRALHPPSMVRLARADAPLGKPLTDADFVNVGWTIDDGTADAALLAAHGKVALRHHRLLRLLGEAKAQGASPTDDDLARALGVDRRTILRDMATLNGNGQRTLTRKRKSTK